MEVRGLGDAARADVSSSAYWTSQSLLPGFWREESSKAVGGTRGRSGGHRGSVQMVRGETGHGVGQGVKGVKEEKGEEGGEEEEKTVKKEGGREVMNNQSGKIPNQKSPKVLLPRMQS